MANHQALFLKIFQRKHPQKLGLFFELESKTLGISSITNRKYQAPQRAPHPPVRGPAQQVFLDFSAPHEGYPHLGRGCPLVGVALTRWGRKTPVRSPAPSAGFLFAVQGALGCAARAVAPMWSVPLWHRAGYNPSPS